VFNIVKATPGDIPLIRELTFQIWPQTYSAILEQDQIDYMLEMMYSEPSLQQQMQEGAMFLIIYADGIPAGFASYQEMQSGIFKLHKIYVLPSQQGRGTGRFLVDFIFDDIKQRGGTALQLQVNRHNKAKIFYEKLGFRVKEEVDIAIGNGYFMNDYIMEKKIG
jgi:ribosomal protein S18 acetylase RimI-like enzyme